MLTRLTRWLFGRPSSHACKIEPGKLTRLHKPHVHQDHDWLRGHDPIEAARTEQYVRHQRRVEHHGLEFWTSPEQEHPSSVLNDEHIPQNACIVKDRKLAREYCIRCFDIRTLYDCME